MSIKACQNRCANSSVWIYYYNGPWNAGEYCLNADEGHNAVSPDHTPLGSALECEHGCLCDGGECFLATRVYRKEWLRRHFDCRMYAESFSSACNYYTNALNPKQNTLSRLH